MTDSVLSNSCPLLELPPELRIRIYEYAYSEERSCCIKFHMYNEIVVSVPRDNQPKEASKLLTTCKAIYEEVLPFHYSKTLVSMVVCGQKPLDTSHYNVLQHSPDLGRIQNLELQVAIWNKLEMDVVLNRVERIARQLSTDRRLKSCQVYFRVGNISHNSPWLAALISRTRDLRYWLSKVDRAAVRDVEIGLVKQQEWLEQRLALLEQKPDFEDEL